MNRLLLAGALLLAVGCGKAKVDGTVYHEEREQSVVRNAGGPVALVPYDSALRRELNSVCAQFRAADDPLRDSAAKYPAQSQFDSYYQFSKQREALRDSAHAGLLVFITALAESAPTTQETDADGRFSFTAVHPGTYALISAAGYGRNGRAWMRPIEVKRDSIRVDLNDAATINYANCYQRPPQF